MRLAMIDAASPMRRSAGLWVATAVPAAAPVLAATSEERDHDGHPTSEVFRLGLASIARLSARRVESAAICRFWGRISFAPIGFVKSWAVSTGNPT
jgi:hypothetical protein